MLFLLLTLAGSARASHAPDQQFARLELPTVVIAAVQPGSRPVRDRGCWLLVASRTPSPASPTSGTSPPTVSDGASTTVVEFALGKDVNCAVNDVRDAIAQVRADLPGRSA